MSQDQRAYQRQLREARKKAGTCTGCGKRRARTNRTTCLACAEHNSRWHNANYSQRRANNLCGACGVNPSTMATCDDCRARRNTNRRLRA